MKFHWFAEVTYPHLPDNIREHTKSTWVTPPPDMMDPQLVGETYRMFIRLMQLADECGFDGLAVNEHHQTPIAMTPSPNLLASALASRTKNAAILVIGDSLALYNPPTRVAEEMAFLDCLSDGRLIAGFVFGIPMDAVFSYGLPPIELRERFHEARLWATERLQELKARTAERLGPIEARIFDPQIKMLEDSEVVEGTVRYVTENRLSAERAFEWRMLELRALWSRTSHPMVLDRLNDLEDLVVRVLHHLLGHHDPTDLAGIDEPVIVVASDLTPSLTVHLDPTSVAGIATDQGTRTSHWAILARSLEIPAVVGLGDIT